MNDEMPNAIPVAATGQVANALTASFAKVPVTLQVILGSTRLSLAELLNLGAGSLIEIDQKLGEPVVVVVNGCKVANGHLFVMDGHGEKLGVRIAQIHNLKDVS